MERGAARPEGAADDPDERPAEPQRRLRDRLLEARQGLRTRDTVRRETGPALEALQRPLRVEPGRAVEDPARKAVRGEQELERRAVLSALVALEHAAPESVAAERPERLARPRADDAVGDDP